MITTLNSFGDAWLEYVSYAVAQNTFFIAVIFMLLYLFRNASARLKYAISIFGIVKLLVPPFLPISFNNIQAATGTATITGDISAMPFEPVAPQLSFVSVLFILWALTIVIYLVATFLSTAELRWRVRHASRLANLSIDGHKFDLYQSSSISVPMSIGIRPKRIYVPDTWGTLNANQQSVLLRHEVAHIKRRDGFLQAWQVFAQALYFFHPLVWLLNERINEYREMACDDLAVERSDVTSLAYSRYLVHVAENMLPSWSSYSASALIKQRNKLYKRVNYQVKENKKMKILSKRKTWFILAAVALLMVPLSWYCTKEQPQEGQLDDEPNISSGITGKILGRVVDKESGEALPGANVVLEGTDSGAATDREGNYYIPNVEPGIYQLKCSFFGFETGFEKDVAVKVEKSTRIDFELNRTQSAPPQPPSSSATYAPYDTPPAPVGGFAKIQQNLVYPEAARKAGIEGHVVLNILIDAKGVVQTVDILKSVRKDVDEAAINAVKSTEWKPAEQNGQPVAVRIGIPVVFRLQ